MFEQAMIPGSPKGKRVLTASVGVAGQVLLVTGMALAPMLWPQVMPPATFVMVVPHAPIGRQAKGKPEVKPQRAHVASIRPFRPTGLVQPPTVPPKIEFVNDLATSSNSGPVGDETGVIGGDPNGSKDGPLFTILQEGQRVQPTVTPKHVVETPKPVEVQIPRVRRGGLVREPRLIHRVDPPYPPLAKAAHIEGAVKLNGVISTNGCIIELSIESGHPLLVKAAMDAVRQWLYEPTQLNGVPVEVTTNITVTFILNR